MTAATPVPARLDDLVLARLATSPQALGADAVARALRAFAPGSVDDVRWAAMVRESIGRLTAGGALDGGGQVAGGAAAAARRFGAAAALPWKRIVERILPGLALGVAAGDVGGHARLKDRDAWAAAIVGRALGLWRAGPPPSASTTGDTIVWRALGLAGNPKRTPPEVRAHFVGQTLGASGPHDRLARMLAAREAGASRADLRGLREALVRRWLCGQEWAGAPGERGPAQELASFAAAVRAAAERATDGVFGGRKVFIASVWRLLRGDPVWGRLPLDDFKQQLIAAHRAGLVVLARADLVGVMDPEEVAASETVHLEARYHFVERGEAS